MLSNAQVLDSDQQRELTKRTDIYNAEVATRLEDNHRSDLGQFFTPSSIAEFMASMFNAMPEEVRLLDAGAGTGSLTVAFIQRACLEDPSPHSIQATAYEIDPDICQYLEMSMQDCETACEKEGVEYTSRVLNEDFIIAGTTMLHNGPLFASSRSTFNRIILNPPYKKIRSTSEHRRLLSSIGVETSNLYSGFLSIAIQLLEPGGEIVAITPRSFCNGPYFKPFRELLLNQVALKRIHIFDSRDKAFQDDDVLQENIIFHAIKQGERNKVVISMNEGPHDPLLSYREVRYDQVVDSQDPNLFIHIATKGTDQLVIDRMNLFTHSLEDLEIEVSTGRVVDFRAREFLRPQPEEDTVPLIYPSHFEDGFIKWPKLGNKKPNAILHVDESESLLLPTGNYVLVKRFSSKEEPRRITAALYLKDNFRTSFVGFENHLNVYHRNKQGLSSLLAKGISVYLNSTLVDQYFRQFSGHTQVNATDLRSLRYPSPAILKHLGEHVGNALPSQAKIDQLLEEVINDMADLDSENPIAVEQKIEEAIEILRLLGMPRAQQNDRSGLTLLALLDLKPETSWSEASAPLMGITPIMDFIRDYYGWDYAPNTRETIRRQTVHQLMQAGLVVPNPDQPDRPPNSPKFCYQVTDELLQLVTHYKDDEWEENLEVFLTGRETLRQKYAMRRRKQSVPITLPDGRKVELAPGKHSLLIRAIVQEFGAMFVPGGTLIYLGGTGGKFKFFESKLLAHLGVTVDEHGKMPDVIIYDKKRNWLVLVEAVTSHGPVDGKRRKELSALFKDAKPGIVYVTAFLTRGDMARYVSEISWETEVWVREAETHLIHFNGERFLGPYDAK